jgi:hypothetical protein
VPASCSPQVSVKINFNNHTISAGTTIWFNASLSVTGLATAPVTVSFDNVKIAFNGQTLPVPSATVVYDPNATTATTTFSGGRFLTTVPLSPSGPAFLTGLAYLVPSTLPGSLKGVTLTGTFSSSAHSVQLVPQFGAATYTHFDPTYTPDGIKPVASSTASSYQNSDPAGTPENEKVFWVTGGTGSTSNPGATRYTGQQTTGNTVTCT